MEQMYGEEFINCLLDFLNTEAVTGNLLKVLCPKAACIFQRSSDIDLTASTEILDITEDNIVIQVAHVPLQLLPHQIEA